MSGVSNKQIETWEDEGGAAHRLDPTVMSLGGTENQVEWALRLKRQVNEEFRSSGGGIQSSSPSADGRAAYGDGDIIAILEEKRSEVMSREDAGYFIRGWQEIGDQVRQLIFQDARYQAIRTNGRHDDVNSSLTTSGG